MKIVNIPKGNGKFRTIYVPNKQEKAHLRSLVWKIADRAAKACPKEVPHGFMRKRSPVTNAQAHVGHEFTLTMDLRDFFATVTEKMLTGKLSAEIVKDIIVDGSARQGLPTSPAAANLAAADMDKAILKWITKNNKQIIYTRYADDLTFSYDDPGLTEILKVNIPQIVKRCGFTLAEEKTHVYSAKAGRRIITGIAVDNELHPTRRIKRKLRAAIHQGNTASANGLLEWCKLKPPKLRTADGVLENTDIKEEVRKLAKVWRLGNVSVAKIPDKGPDEDLGKDCIVTGDPVYHLGMSTFTTGWVSCMRQPTGQYRRGTIFWMHLRGTRIAAYLSNKTAVFGGVERRQMKARCLVHTLRNGVKCYDKLYGDNISAMHLRNQLESAGYIGVYKARELYKNEKVEGHAPAGWRAYFDSLGNSTSKAVKGQWAGKQVRICHL